MVTLNSTNTAATEPFLKWAGGKRWLIDKHQNLLNYNGERLIEPFLGSAAIFFGLTPNTALLSDKNENLIETYLAVKNDWERVLFYLSKHANNHSKDYYYRVRSAKLRTSATRAAQFIYLNRTCWNGLYRVNKNGAFNVPIGTKDSVLLSTDNFESVALKLKNADIDSSDFILSSTIRKAKKGDFLFVDPPYTVKHNYNGFVKYNETLFNWEDQIRLRDDVVSAKKRGARVAVTNAYHESILKLYDGIGTHRKLSRNSVISGIASKRGKYEELLITI